MTADEHSLSTVVDGNATVQRVFAALMLIIAATVAIFSVALTLRAYMPCPFWDGWTVISDLASGASPTSLRWLWSQHNEHRIVIGRLLIWLDLAIFGGKNLSLLLEIYAIQLLHWLVIALVIERLTDFSTVLKRTMQGLFAFSLFHPNQVENFTWGFEVSYVLSFAICTVGMLALVFLDRWRNPSGVFAWTSFMPLIAATTLASGLLLGPMLVFLSVVRGMSRRAIMFVAGVFLASSVVYFNGYTRPAAHGSPLTALNHPVALLRYISAYFDSSWPFFAHFWLFLCILIALIVLALKTRSRVTAFEWFCIAECLLMLSIAVITAFGRLSINEPNASRYQTCAMIYWGALFSLILINVQRWRPVSFGPAQCLVLLICATSFMNFRALWELNAERADLRKSACAAIIKGSTKGIEYLGPSPEVVDHGMTLLRRRWDSAVP